MNAFAIRDFDTAFGSWQEQLPATGTDWLDGYRRQALADLREQGLPGAKTEDWKYTRVKDLVARDFVPATTATPVAVPQCEARHLAVMVNGFFSSSLSRLGDLPDGVYIDGLAATLNDEPARVEKLLGKSVSHHRHPFAALNGAFFQDGLVVDVAPDTRLEEPLVIFWLTGAGNPEVCHPRLLVNLGQGAEATLMEQHRGGQVAHLNNQVSEIVVGDNARLQHIQLQGLGRENLIAGTHVHCGRDCYYQAQTFDFGGALVRNDLQISLDEAGSEAVAEGLYLAGGKEHVDNHARIDHRAPHCQSQAYYKGLLGKGGHGVFNSKLIVHPAGQKTDAGQTNHNLLLSPDVEIDTKPELEIYADDVKCNHGSTTGELDPDHLFYLRSRGIAKDEAYILLVGAFANEVVNRVRDDRLRQTVSEALATALPRLTDTEVV